MTDMCAWPNCEAALSTTLDLPVCDRHAIKVYRAVHATMQQQPAPRMPINLAAPRRATTAGRNAKSNPGTIYFAKFGGLVKIGFTTNMRERMRSLKPDRVLATMPGTMRDEEALHHRFGEHWVEREMFIAAPELMAYIDTLRAPA